MVIGLPEVAGVKRRTSFARSIVTVQNARFAERAVGLTNPGPDVYGAIRNVGDESVLITDISPGNDPQDADFSGYKVMWRRQIFPLDRNRFPLASGPAKRCSYTRVHASGRWAALRDRHLQDELPPRSARTHVPARRRDYPQCAGPMAAR